MPRRKADWLGWVLQFIFGFIVGGALGCYVIHRRHVGEWFVNDDVVAHFIVGAGMLAAALASHSGDRLWMDYKVIPPDAPDQSLFSLALSLLFGLAGAGLMAFAVLRTLSLV
jgi:hypothetical protein